MTNPPIAVQPINTTGASKLKVERSETSKSNFSAPEQSDNKISEPRSLLALGKIEINITKLDFSRQNLTELDPSLADLLHIQGAGCQITLKIHLNFFSLLEICTPEISLFGIRKKTSLKEGTISNLVF